MSASNPWYKEPWPWLLMAPIVTTMIVGFSMLGVAIKTSDGLVTDDYYREGVLYNENKARDDLAKTMGISGLLTMDEITGDILLMMEFGQAEPVARIEGALRSPTFRCRTSARCRPCSRACAPRPPRQAQRAKQPAASTR